MLILNNVEIVTFNTDCTSTPELLFASATITTRTVPKTTNT